MSTPRVTAVIVAYKAREIISAAVGSLRAAHEAGLCACIVVDNDSGDGTPDLLRAEQPWATVMESGGNLGFGRGCNVGLAAAETEFVLFLNPDAELDLDALRHLVEFMDRHPNAGLVAPAIREPDGDLQVTHNLPTPLGEIRRFAGMRRSRPIQPGEDAFRTEWICGAAILARRELLDELGGFDPRFFLYYEETDLCRRTLARGHEVWAVPAAVARHRSGTIARATRLDLFQGCIARHYFESRFYYFVKHFGWPAAAFTEAAATLVMTARAGVRVLRGRPIDDFRSRIRAPFFRLPAKVDA